MAAKITGRFFGLLLALALLAGCAARPAETSPSPTLPRVAANTPAPSATLTAPPSPTPSPSPATNTPVPTPSPAPTATPPVGPELVFFNDNGLFLVGLDGGEPRLISNQAWGLAGNLLERGWKWSPEGGKLVYPQAGEGAAVKLALLDLDQASQVEIDWTPLNREYNFTAGYAWLPGGETLVVLEPERYAFYRTSDGRLVGEFPRRDFTFFQFSPLEQAMVFLNPQDGALYFYALQVDGAGQISLAPDALRRVALPGKVYFFAISPGGEKIAAAYGVADWERPAYKLVILDAAGGAEQVVLAEEGALVQQLDWSPGGERLGFTRLTVAQEAWPHWIVYSYDLAGQTLSRVSDEDVEGWRFDWSPDGSQMLVEQGGRLILSNPDGSGKIPLLAGETVRAASFRPSLGALPSQPVAGIPADLWLAYELWESDLSGSLLVARPDGSQATTVSQPVPWSFGPARCIQWSPQGDMLAYVEESSLMLKIYDFNSGETIAIPDGSCTYSWHPDNRTLAKSYRSQDNTEIQLYAARNGKLLAALSQPGLYYFAFSPDGKLFAHTLGLDTIQFIQLGLTSQAAFAQLGSPLATVNGLQVDTNLQWSPDGSQVAYLDNSEGLSKIMAVSPGAPGAIQLAGVEQFPGAEAIWDFTWSPQGSQLAVTTSAAGGPTGTRLQLFVLNLSDGGVVQLSGLAGSPILEGADPAWLPDGESLIFTANPNSEFTSTVWAQADGSRSQVLGLASRAHRVVIRPPGP